MTSRFAASYLCLNGPKEGDWVDAPCQVDVGSAVALPWFDSRHILRYCVYVLVAREAEPAPEEEPQGVRLGLMFMNTHDTAERAQEHVHRLTAVAKLSQYAGSEN